jgi:hypothetical protein
MGLGGYFEDILDFFSGLVILQKEYNPTDLLGKDL